jgi:xanthine/uracil permease
LVVTPAVAVSGFKIVVMGNGFARRNRFILSCALALGLGVTLAPQVRLSLDACSSMITLQDTNL